MNTSRVLCLGLFAAALAVLAGCGKKDRGITGKVTYKSQPVPGAIVTLYATQGTDTFSVRTGTDGTFTLPQVPDNVYKVSITAASAAHEGPQNPGGGMMAGGSPMMKMKMGGGAMAGAAGKGEAMEKKESEMRGKVGETAAQESLGADIKLPKKYAHQETSGLTWDTRADPNKEFALTD